MTIAKSRATAAAVVAAGWWAAAAPALAGAPQLPAPAPTGTQEIPAPAAPIAGAAVACVDVRYIATTSKRGQAVFARVTELGRAKTAELEAKARALEEEQRALQQDPAFLSDSAPNGRARAIERAQVEFQRMREDAEADVLALQREVEAEFDAAVRPIIDAVSRERGLQFVFDIERASLVWVAPGADISDEIIKRLDAEP